MEGKIFVEKEFYVEPPTLSETATEEEIKKAWATWIKANAKERAKHKRRWTKAQKPGELPNFDRTSTVVKVNGVWKQCLNAVGYIGSLDLGTLEAVLLELPTQDRHFQARGKRADRTGNRHKSRRTNRKKKTLKTQRILNKSN